jgi:hypothetical protein
LKRLLGLFLIFSTLLYAYSYNYQLLQVYAKIAPRMMLLVEDPASEPAEHYLLCILYETGNEVEAESLRKMILSAYPDGLKSHPLDVRAVRFDECTQCQDAALILMLDADERTIASAATKAHGLGIATMAYSSRFLKEGVMMSLDLGATVRPYLNLKAAKSAGIPVNDVLLRVSRIYSGGATP